MTVVSLLVAALTVAVAGVVQRLGGIGFALVASPVLIAISGPDEAVKVVLMAGVASATATLIVTWAHFQPREVLALVPFAVLAVWPVGVLAEGSSPDTASIIAGTAVLLALVVALRPRAIPGEQTWAAAALVGGLSGAMNAVAALGGPMASAYGLRRRWAESMVANVSAYLLITSLAVLVVRGPPASTHAWQLALLMAVAVAGVRVGDLLDRRIPARATVAFTVIVAVLGAFLAIARGIWGTQH